MFNLLYVTWDVNPVLLQIGPLAIRYYSLLFIAGFPFGYWLFTKFYNREGKNIELLEPVVTIKSALNADSEAQLDALCKALIK